MGSRSPSAEGCQSEMPQAKVERGSFRIALGISHLSLLADSETFDQLGVAGRVLALQIVEQPATLTDELQ